MPLPQPLADVVSEETKVLDEVLTSLREQRDRAASRHAIESERAQSLTSEIVASRRVEEKAMLASDEAVAHALRDKGAGDLVTLHRLLDKPYFARFIVEEESPSGSKRSYEYRLGLAANPDCRIIDWRKAPISTLYYEYKEGESYSEVIQGRERTGVVTLRNSLEISKGVLRRVSCRFGTAVRSLGGTVGNTAPEWHVAGAVAHGIGERPLDRLPSVLALITAEQFRAITEDAKSAVLIQGTAGSGKTTVALHRLAWLLHEENSPLRGDETAVVVLGSALCHYIRHSLAALDISSVPVATFAEWAAQMVRTSSSHLLAEDAALPRFRRPHESAPSSIERLMKSTAMLQATERYVTETDCATRSPCLLDQILFEVLERPHLILSYDDSKLIDNELIAAARERASRNIQERVLDSAADGLIARLHQLIAAEIERLPSSSGGSATKGLYRHLVVDEVQDFGAAELASIIGAVEELSGLTIVGDVQQQLGSTFPGWEKLRTHWDSGESMSRFLSLTVSHRTTVEIMALAAHIGGERGSAGRGAQASRHGRVPIWFRAHSEARGISSALQWLKTAVERYPASITAVLCRDRSEAKYVHSLLQPTFGAAVRLGSDHSFTFEEGLLVSDVQQVKGLEFTNVLLWNPTAKSYPSGDEHRNALYVGATRAEENLAIVTWAKPSPHLPNPFGKLVRLFEIEEPVEDEERERAGG